ncbi:MAG: PilW family protein [Xanthomonadaceae bacterium]|nr:PilW family protein [Xanthomonadaceae bacterium]
MMIAMVLGLIVIAGVTSVFLAGQKSFRTNNALADVQDSSRIAFELMARDIREAGSTGCNSANNRVTNVLANSPGNASTPAWWADWSNAVHGYDSSSTDPALSGLNQVAGTDSLELISTGDLNVTIANDDPGVNFKLNSSTDQLTGGDVIVACSPDHAAILQISNYNNSNVTVDYNTGNTNQPGNCSSNLGYPNNACTGNSPDYTFPPNSNIAKLTAADWYIGTNPEGGTSLYRVDLENSGGNMTTATQEMVRNVTGMTITYLNPSISGLGNQFLTATQITANNGWAGVTAVNVALTIQSTFQRASVDASKPITRSYAFTTTLRNRVH